jgi:asparagine synthase (glutamine-hydrolysing)
MSGLCGWVGRPGASESAEQMIRVMASHLTGFDNTVATVQSGSCHGLASAGARGQSTSGSVHGYSVAIWGDPRFADGDLARRARDMGVVPTLVGAFQRMGPDCCRALRGGFALAIVNDASGEALLAIDRIGVHTLSYRATADALVFGSTANAIHGFPGLEPAIDWQSIYHYVHFHMVPGPGTAFVDEQRLLPGHFLHLRDGQRRIGRYWQMDFVEDKERPFAELRDEFMSILNDAVRRMSAGASTGAFLSGGTDSSTVSGLLGKVTGTPAQTFSIGFAEQGYDEMEYARIAARHFKTSQHEYYVTPEDIVDAIPRLGAIYDQPFGNSSAVPTYCCARFARESGMEMLLGGDGGDELFGGNERYATQYRFSHYERLPSMVRRALLEPVARALPGGRLIPPIRWYRRLVELASTPMPDRMDAHNLLVRFGPGNVFTEDFLASIDRDGPRQLMRDVYDGAGADSLINKMLAYDFRFTLADSDLPKVVRSCELAGLPVSFPMLDDDLLDFSARLAPNLKLKGTTLRYFFKEALRGFLPDEIITKSKHGFGLPFGPWLRTHRPLNDMVMDRLSGLRKRGFVRTDFLDQLMNVHLREHAGYYGTMAWVLMMLEEWFGQHGALKSPANRVPDRSRLEPIAD